MEKFPNIAKARMAAAKPGPHPDAEQLSAFAENALASAERETVLVHLATCVDCRDVVGLATEARPADAAVSKPARGGFRWATFQWAAVAASLAIVTLAVLVVGPHQQTGERARDGVAAKQEPTPAAARSASAAGPALKKPASSQSSVGEPAAKEMTAPRRDADTKLDKEERGKAQTESGYVADGVNITGGGFGGIGVYTRIYGSKSTGGIVSVPKDEKKKQSSAADAIATSAPPASGSPRQHEAGSLADLQVAGAVNQPTPPIQKPSAQAASPAPVNGERVEEQDKTRNELSKDLSASNVAASTDSVELSGKAAAKGKSSAQPAKTSPAGAANAGMVAARFDSAPMLWRAVGGRVQSTTDSGATWQDHSPPSGAPFTAVAAAGQDVFAGGNAGILFASHDGGQTWTGIRLTTLAIPFAVSDIKITNPKTVDVILRSGDDWQSTDGGTSFQLLPRKP